MDESTRPAQGLTRTGNADETPGDAAADATRPGALAALLAVFLHPRRTFESMRDRPRFLVPLIVLLVAQTAMAYAMFRSGVIAEHTIAKMEEQGKDPQSIEAVQTFFEGPGGLLTSVVTAPFATAMGVVLGAAVLFFMANLMMGARLRF